MATYTTVEQVQALENEELERVALATLPWPIDSYWSNKFGHAKYRTTGFPTSFDNKRFEDRRSYLLHRLRKTVKRTGVVFDEDGKQEAARLKKEKTAKKQAEIEARPKVSRNVRVEMFLEEASGKSPHKFVIILSDGKVVVRRADDSIGRAICTQKVTWTGKDFADVIKALSEDSLWVELDDAVKLPSGLSSNVKLVQPSLTGVQLRAKDGTDLTFSRKGSKVNVGRYGETEWTFNLTDLKTLGGWMTEKLVVVPVPEGSSE